MVEIRQIFNEEIIQRMKGLNEAFNSVFFPNKQQVKYQNELWMKDPFTVDARPSNVSAEEYETFIEMTSDSEKF